MLINHDFINILFLFRTWQTNISLLLCVNKDTGEVEEKKYRLKDTYCEEFWGDILKSPYFQGYVRKRFQLGASGTPSEVSEEDTYDEE